MGLGYDINTINNKLRKIPNNRNGNKHAPRTFRMKTNPDANQKKRAGLSFLKKGLYIVG